MTSEILDNFGYQATPVYDSNEAIKLFSEDPAHFDMVITDQTMPKMNGAELAEKILMIRADIPIIMCTGYSDYIDEESAARLGIKAFKRKPLDINELTSTVKEFMKKSN